MSIAEALKAKTLELRKARDEIAPGLQRVLSLAQGFAKERGLKSGEITTPINDDEAVRAINTGIKQLNDTLDQVGEAGKESDLYVRSVKEKEILQDLLPKMASDDEVTNEVRQFIASQDPSTVSMKMMGAIMKHLQDKFGLTLNKATASGLVKAELSK